MEILIHKSVDEDIKQCCRKKWYLGIDKEFPKVMRLLQAKGFLPGESPFHYLPKEITNKIFLHARICLPGSGTGKSKGPRIIYYINENRTEAKVLYIGGHKDNVYDTPKIVKVLEIRFLSGDFYHWTEA